ncbi:MAG TPA: hypothetical protein VER77_03265, partial [Candidatus Dormibacteraeota bacterium]|nr:hypothetical protein [Candidatus Dormibacteraeota bacterium]
MVHIGLDLPQLCQDFPLAVEPAAARRAVAAVVAPIPAIVTEIRAIVGQIAPRIQLLRAGAILARLVQLALV